MAAIAIVRAAVWLRKQSQRQHHSRLLTRCATGKAVRDLSTTGGTTFSAETMVLSRACRLWPRKASWDGCDGVRGVPRQLSPSRPASAGLNARVWTASIISYTMKMEGACLHAVHPAHPPTSAPAVIKLRSGSQCAPPSPAS